MRKRSLSLQAAPLSKSDKGVGHSRRQLYAVGNPALGGEGLERVQTLRNAPLAPLPETEREVEAIAGLMLIWMSCSTFLIEIVSTAISRGSRKATKIMIIVHATRLNAPLLLSMFAGIKTPR
jgi:hypothetical protein